MTFDFTKTDYTLRDLVFAHEGDTWFEEHKADILFELNHLELHEIDGYLLECYKRGMKSKENNGNSSVAYLLGLTIVEPVGRVKTKGGTMPDVDTDFPDDRREDVKNYIRSKYGDEYTSNIGTFNVSKCKGIFKDVSRIFNVPFDQANAISKTLPDDGSSITEALEASPELQKACKEDENLARVFEYAAKLEGSIRAVGVHASGFAITNEPVTDIVPLFESKGEPVTQFDGPTLENMGIFKFDLLGLKTLTVIERTLKIIREKRKEDIDIDSISLDDPNVFNLLSSGDLLGIFQIEGSQGLMDFAANCKPNSIKDLSAIIALYRPGPMGMGAHNEYIRRKSEGSNHSFDIPEFNYIFEDTHGLLVYQEQLMRLSRDMCGFTDIEADVLRKAVGKKDRELLLSQKEKFVNGAVKHTGQDKDRISKLFDTMEEFARYCFNLSHSISYAFVAYQTAWLKTYYKKEFLASMISCENDMDQKSLYISNARQNKIRISPPDINNSSLDFTVGDDESILFGFNSIKGVGEKVALRIMELGPYNSVGDFLIKAHHGKGINKKAIESLINCGALDSFGYKRSALLAGYGGFVFDYVNSLEKANEYEEEVAKSFIEKQEDYFDNTLGEIPFLALLDREKELLGIYLSGNPFDFIRENIPDDDIFNSIDHILEHKELANKKIRLLCRIENVKKTVTKKNKEEMAFIDITDRNGKNQSMVIFPKQYALCKERINKGVYVILSFEYKERGNTAGVSTFSLIVDNVLDLTRELNARLEVIERESAIQEINIVFKGIPSIVRAKSINKYIEDFYKEGKKNDCIVNLMIEFTESHLIKVKEYKVNKIDISFLRTFSRIKDIYLYRNTNGE